MKRVGVVLAVLGVVCVVVGLFPQWVMDNPKPGFGPQQTIAVVVGGVLVLVGLVLLCVGKKKPAAGSGASATSSAQG